MHQPDGIHTIPVPRSMSVEQAWECIARNVALADPEPEWANIEVKDGQFVRVVPLAEIDLLSELNDLYRRIAMCKRHPRTAQVAYEAVWIGLCDAMDGIHDALNGWPGVTEWRDVLQERSR